jgi:hypothetical protein
LKTWIPFTCVLALAFAAAPKVHADSPVIFEDNFASLDPSFTPSPAIQAKDGKLTITMGANGWERLLYQVGFFSDSDLSLTFSCTAGDATSGNAVGILFWGTDTSNFYLAEVTMDGGGYIFRLSGGRWLTPASVPASPAVKKGIGASNLVRVVTKGNRATLYINGTQVTAITGIPPSGGGLVGIYSQCDNVPATWTAQDFKISSVP